MADDEYADAIEDVVDDIGQDGEADGECAADAMEAGDDEDKANHEGAAAASKRVPAADSDTASNQKNGVTSEPPKSGSQVNSREDDERKIFVGGLHWETTEKDLREYFSKFGKVVDCTLKMDQATGKSRGFGFVLFEDIACVDKVVADKSHTLHDRTIDAKRALARGGSATAKAEPCKKVFVGGLSPDFPESEIREFFSQYGKVEEIELPFDKLKGQRRAFVFITYDSEECVEKAISKPKQTLGDKEVDVRKATPKSDQDSFSSRGGRGGMPRGGGPGRGGASYGYSGPGGYQYAPPAGGYPGYDYSAYYGQPPYGYGAYPGYGAPGYDYSAYYSQPADWSGYGQGYSGYPGYDYSGYYASSDPSQGAAGSAAAGYKAKRGTGGASGGYHPYSR